MENTTAVQVGAQQLVRVFEGVIGGMSEQVCDGRELHVFLRNGKQFADWIKQRIGQYGFEENQDFAIASPKSEAKRGGHNRTDYHLSLDMAKELSMVENNEQGRMARRYFIDMERRAHAQVQLPSSEPAIEQRAFRGCNVLIASIDGRPWFAAGNLCTALGLGSSDRLTRSLPVGMKRRLQRGSRLLWLIDSRGAARAADYCKPDVAEGYRAWLGSIVPEEIRARAEVVPFPTRTTLQPPTERELVDTPEAAFLYNPAVDPLSIDDVMSCGLVRSLAVVRLLLGDVGEQGGFSHSAATVTNALWLLEGQLEQMRNVIMNYRKGYAA